MSGLFDSCNCLIISEELSTLLDYYKTIENGVLGLLIKTVLKLSEVLFAYCSGVAVATG